VSVPDSRPSGSACLCFYRTRTETEDSVVESKIAISKISDLAIEVDKDRVAGEGNKSHYSTHSSYTGIHAPPVLKGARNV
jgi:hypothetical protein